MTKEFDYEKFLDGKRQLSGNFGFRPTFMPEMLFGFQKELVRLAVEKGRFAEFADCGLGKTFIQLTWAQNVVEKTNRPVLILTPLAVGHQTVIEAAKLGVDAIRCPDGKLSPDHKIFVANYERLHYFNPNDFSGCVCDESSILKNFDGVIKAAITDFMRKMKYRLLCTATAAPNDFVELGTSSEALGDLGHMDMLGRFFKKTESTMSRKDENRSGLYRFRGHAEKDFWRWVCSWSRSIRKPSDMGYSDDGFTLPELNTRQHIVKARTGNPEYLFDMPANGLAEQRAERSRSVTERCEMAAYIANGSKEQFVSWCYLNREGDALTKMIDGAVQVSGDDADEFKEETFSAFASGQIRVVVTKPKIAGMGLNWQHCHRQTFFPSHSFEQWYQSIRRCWRFGQKNPVTVDVITSEGETNVLANLMRKSEAADRMFANLVSIMKNELVLEKLESKKQNIEIPNWI